MISPSLYLSERRASQDANIEGELIELPKTFFDISACTTGQPQAIDV